MAIYLFITPPPNQAWIRDPPPGATSSVPVRRPLLDQAIIVARRELSPTVVGVVSALVRQNQDLLIEGDNPVVVVCHAGSLMAEGDILWRRPDPSIERNGAYDGPPIGEPAAADWHPEQNESAPLPRKLPVIDNDAVDAAEREATRFTHAIGVIAVFTLLILVCWRVF
jgi:hypothetical protein